MSSTKQAPGFQTQQLRFGAYWDPVPPLYNFQTVQGPALNAGTESTFPKWVGRHPIKVPKALGLQLLWEVAEYTAKLEFEVLPESNGYEVTSHPAASTSDGKYLATWDLPTLTEWEYGIIAAKNFETRDLKLPQGDMMWVKTADKYFTSQLQSGQTPPYMSLMVESYDTNNSEAINQVVSAWEEGGIRAFKAYDIAADIYFDRGLTFSSEKSKASTAVTKAISDELNKLTLMRVSNEKSLYLEFKEKITAEIQSFGSWSSALKSEFQEKLDDLESEFSAIEEPSPVENRQFARRAIHLGEEYKNKIHQRAQLSWFAWENGFEKELDFPPYAKQRLLAPWGFFNARPPSLEGAFVGVFAPESEEDPTEKDFHLVIDLPSRYFTFTLTKTFDDQDGMFQSNEWLEEEGVEYTVLNPDFPVCKYQIDGVKFQNNYPSGIIPKDADPLTYCIEELDEIEDENGDVTYVPNGVCALKPENLWCAEEFKLTASKFKRKYPSPVEASSLSGEEGESTTDAGTGSVMIEFVFNLNQLGFTEFRAEANFDPKPYGRFIGGYYYDMLSTPERFFQGDIALSDVYDIAILTKHNTPFITDYPPVYWYLPDTPVSDFEEGYDQVNSVVYSGSKCGNGGEGAIEEFDKLVTDCTKLRETDSETEEKGTFTIKDKEGNTLLEFPLYGKTLIPIKNVKLTYTIKRYNWEPPEEEEEQDPDLID
jgi:hypothetical protein